MFIGKLFDEYNIDFPETREVIITGMNNSGKTKLLELTRDYYIANNKKVLYFETDRKLSISKEEIESLIIINKLTTGEDYLKSIEYSFDISDPFTFNSMKKGDYINNGYMQILNFMFNVLKEDNKFILIIDNFERNLHPLLRRHLLNTLLSFNKIEQIIISVYEFKYWGNNTVYDIETLLNKGGNLK